MSAANPSVPLFLRAPGEMARRIREMDWSRTSVGPISGMAAEPAHLAEHLLRVAIPAAALVGTGAPHPVQRRVHPDLRKKAPLGARRRRGCRPGARYGTSSARCSRA